MPPLRDGGAMTPLSLTPRWLTPLPDDVVKAGRLRPGLRVYAVGDIHGYLDLLRQLLRQILQDLEARPVPEAAIVCLGDYVDRGPDSAGVLRALQQLQLPQARLLCLMGNHEDMMLRVAGGDWAAWYNWIVNGGAETLMSYGIESAVLQQWERDRDRGEPAAGAQEALAGHMRGACGADLGWLAALPPMLTIDGYAFVHAGLRPGVPIAAQRVTDMLWIRHEFLGVEHDFGKVVVHGHTPAFPQQSLRHRIGIDTGAYATGVLSAVVLEGEDRRFLHARR